MWDFNFFPVFQWSDWINVYSQVRLLLNKASISRLMEPIGGMSNKNSVCQVD